MSGKGARACAEGPSNGDARREYVARGVGMTSSAGTFSPRVRFSFASRFLRVSVTVGVAGVPGVVGVTGIGVRFPLPLFGARPVVLLSVTPEEGGVARRGSDGGSATAFRRKTRGVGRGARLLLLLDFSRTWRAKDLGVGRDWVDASELLESVLDRGRASDAADELADEDAYSYAKGLHGGENSNTEPWRRLRSCFDATGLGSGFSFSPMGRGRERGKEGGDML